MRGMSCPVSASSCGTSSGLNLADTVQTICVLLTDTISMCLWSTKKETKRLLVSLFFMGIVFIEIHGYDSYKIRLMPASSIRHRLGKE